MLMKRFKVLIYKIFQNFDGTSFKKSKILNTFSNSLLWGHFEALHDHETAIDFRKV